MIFKIISLFIHFYLAQSFTGILPFQFKNIFASVLLLSSSNNVILPESPISDMEVIKLDNNNVNSYSPNIRVFNNNIFFYGPITDQTCRELNDILITLDNNSKTFSTNFAISPPPINLHIQSEGGSLMNSFYIMDLIKNMETPVNTFVDGYVASAGSLLSVMGKKRYMTKNSFIMIHQLSSSLGEGKFNDLDDNMDNLNKFMDTIRNIYLSQTKIPENKLNTILEHDLWMNSQECLEYGLVDEVI